MSQFKVPQNIDLEDRIFGPLTLKQFIYLMSGGMIIYASFEIFEPFLFWIIALPTALLTLSLTFVKIQDQPFAKFLTSAAFFMVKPKKRKWHKDPASEKFTEETLPERELPKEKPHTIKTVEKSQLESLANLLDTHKIEDVAEHQNMDLPKAKEKNQESGIKNQAQKIDKKEKVKDIFS